MINFRLHQKTGDETDAEAEAKAKAQYGFLSKAARLGRLGFKNKSGTAY